MIYFIKFLRQTSVDWDIWGVAFVLELTGTSCVHLYLYLSCFSSEYKKIFLKLCLQSDLLYRMSNYQSIWWYWVVSDLSPTLGKIGHRWFLWNKWYTWWQNQWFRLCFQRSHNSYKLFWRKNPQKILLTFLNFDLNVIKCPILPLFTVPVLCPSPPPPHCTLCSYFWQIFTEWTEPKWNVIM